MSFENETSYDINNLPSIGQQAPHFKGLSTQGDITLDDYKGQWMLLFAYPYDFSPVSTSEFITLQENYEELKDLQISVVGLSVDSIASHIAWLTSIESSFNTNIEFPLIADSSKQISKNYGILSKEDDNQSATRAVLIIDDNLVVRSIMYYPAAIGRNVKEIIRMVKAIKTSDENDAITPENWQPGDKVLALPPSNVKDAKGRVKGDNYKCKTWYYCEKDIEHKTKKIYNAFLQDE
ncbi:peroxiredoxin [Staphylococcus shinii]|jgi:peroxiredoxin (alkyl hydroperoxide reductase subunit C)|uniref:peroxiredoxin n=1 Tax=Staphylococcus shinii TaxID=2912228 RepID=UPI000C34CE4C|nr:peroxiredoxin [Staphylococcus shinii]MDW8569837.1 peroxiredoxin [Staphylococcus shinii]MDW8574261.1 peroxiredoxin [Staphylococcus shinii]PKI09606.1 peroxiredoxin [Staphylococcus shinii]PKI12226.1 peroxiredoxin [Staphylococcus shinii]